MKEQLTAAVVMLRSHFYRWLCIKPARLVESVAAAVAGFIFMKYLVLIVLAVASKHEEGATLRDQSVSHT